jgi:hypothetical protein
MSAFVELAPEESSLATSLAEATHQRYSGASGHYRNLPRSHLLGKLGETAVEKWLRSEGFDPDPAYRDPEREREPDLLVDGRGIEVKCWRPDTWTEMGRCVTPAQMPGMQKKIQSIVWGIVEDEREPVGVELAGWSTPDEVAATETRPTGPKYKPIMNHQMDLESLLDLADLVALLRA